MKNFKKNKNDTTVSSPRRRGSSLCHPRLDLGSMNRGFTLIELLVVIAIIGMLAATVLTSLGAARAKGRDAKRVADLQNIQLILTLYADGHSGQYPADIYGNDADWSQLIKTPLDPMSTKYGYGTVETGTAPNVKKTRFMLEANLETKGAATGGDCDFALTDDDAKCAVAGPITAAMLPEDYGTGVSCVGY